MKSESSVNKLLLKLYFFHQHLLNEKHLFIYLQHMTKNYLHTSLRNSESV